MLRYPFFLALVFASLILVGCNSSDSSSESSSESPSDQNNATQNPPNSSVIDYPAALTRVSDAAWDETAVRQVLHTFAFGSHASDDQIQAWAAQNPEDAIEEILHAREFHPQLNGVTNRKGLVVHAGSGRLRDLSDFWSSDHSDNPVIGESARNALSVDHWRSPSRVWVRAAHTPGLNPVRQKIGLFLTNYHAAVNEEAGVNRHQILDYYDTLMDAVGQERPFEEVLTLAAAHAAVAVQYNHQHNRFENGNYRVNEDFAREYFQLFFGILTDRYGDDDYHENVTIPNMARLLTEMRPEERNGDPSTRMVFERYKTASASEVLHRQISGSNAWERLQNLAPHAIEHPDSLHNLPVLIIRGLADDKLMDYPERKERLRHAWEAMPEKNLMAFLRHYAISTDFHTPERVNYLNTFDRWLILANRMVTDVEDATLDIYGPGRGISHSGFEVFRPHHDVFGSQTGEDAYTSSEYFMRTLNAHADDWSLLNGLRRYQAQDEELGIDWRKSWSGFLPEADSQAHCLATWQLGEWLWERFVADDLEYFGPLERIHVYSFINSGLDITYNWREANIGGVQYDSALTLDELTRGGLKDYFKHQGEACIFLETEEQKRDLVIHLGQAVNFIATTPYFFVQEGR